MWTLQQLEARQQAWPSFSYPDLPVTQQREQLLQALGTHQVLVIAGETGSGKTTQLPKLCLEAGYGLTGLIGHTQPRRLAARSIAQRLAEELQVPLGQQVGYQVRFQDQQSELTLVKVMTDGILLAEIQKDPLLKRYQLLILDEAHERSLNIDFLLGYLKRILPQRPDLKLIITSATLDLERFSRHFNQCPIIEVSGRNYPVEVLYRPLLSDDPDTADLSEQEGILQALEEIRQLEKQRGWQHGPRDVLVFLSGEREIRDTAHELRRQQGAGRLRGIEVLPLYARLPASEQQRIFQPGTQRRVILSTNVAETSLTVPGIRYVIDTGKVRISRYSHRAGVQRLPVEPVSQASANQRAGRCGRIAEGICIRLYAEEDFILRPAFTEPEIQRSNLASVILQMLSLKLGDIEAFPFVQPPDKRFIKDGFRHLFELGAVNKQQQLTAQGRQLARLPLDPRLGRMLLQASRQGCLSEMLVLAAALNLQDPRERPTEQQQAADQAHSQWRHPESDFVSLLNLWYSYEQQRQELSENQLRKWCKKNFLSFMRLREWRDSHRQLKLLCRDLGWKENTQPADYASLHQALLSGLLTHIGQLGEKREYQGTRQRKFFLHPATGLGKKTPKWIMAAELVETSRLYARHVARIEPEWVEPLASHLVKYSYSSPHWEKKAARVVALEQVSLLGLILVSGRKKDYSPVAPQEAREIFIRSALVEGDYQTSAAFMQHNQALLGEVQQLEDKARRRDLLVDDQVLYEFYDQRIPAHICKGRDFEYWLKQQPEDHLLLTRELLLARAADDISQVDFPDHLHWQGIDWPLSYHFAPGEEDDGVTLTLPLALLGQLPVNRLQWLVPGLLREKCTALMKSLPKQLRKHFVPLPNYLDALLDRIEPDDQPLTQVLAQTLYQITGVRLPEDAWQTDNLPPHLCMNFRVLDEQGQLLAQGRDLATLQQRFSRRAAAQTQQLASDRFQQTGATDWCFGKLPEQIETEASGIRLRTFPALVDEGQSVAVQVFDTQNKATQAHLAGVVRLLRLQLPQQEKYLLKHLPQLNQLKLLYTGIGTAGQLVDDLLLSGMRAALATAALPLPHSQEDFAQMRQQAERLWVAEVTRLADQLLLALQLRLPLVKRLQGRIDLSLAMILQDANRQLEGLFYPGFIWDAGTALADYPRYLKALALRLDKAPRDRQRDLQAMREIHQWQDQWQQRYQQQKQQGYVSPGLVDFRWLLEEFRVSLYAQQLGTRQTVSARRLADFWQKMD